jgi:glutamyl-tRNA reductase
VTGPVLDELFRHALQAGKRVRTDTDIARGTTSFAHAATEQTRARLGGSFAGHHLCVVGAGEIGSGVLRAVGDQPADAPASVVVVNRTPANAEAAIAASGLVAEVDDLSALAAALGKATVCVTALDTDTPVITAEMVGDRSANPLLICDLGLPRNGELAIRSLPGVTVIDIEDLTAAIDAARGDRAVEAVKAEQIVNDEVHAYRNAVRARGAAPVIAALRGRFEAVRTTELERRRSEFPNLTDDEWEQVDGLTRAILAKVLHEPTVVVKDAAGTPRGERLVEALRTLFDL